MFSPNVIHTQSIVNREFDSVGNSLYFVYRKGLPKGERTKLTSVATYSNIDSALIYCL